MKESFQPESDPYVDAKIEFERTQELTDKRNRVQGQMIGALVIDSYDPKDSMDKHFEEWSFRNYKNFERVYNELLEEDINILNEWEREHSSDYKQLVSSHKRILDMVKQRMSEEGADSTEQKYPRLAA